MRQRSAFFHIGAAIAILSAGCSPRITHLRHNPLRDAYQATTVRDTASAAGKRSWFTLRNSVNLTVIRDSSAAASIARKYNALPAGKRRLSRIRVEGDPGAKADRFTMYSVGRWYFRGIDELSKGNPDGALEALGKAEDRYPELLYRSDLNYLRGAAFLMKGDTVLAANAFATFDAFSESVCSPIFHLRSAEPDSLYLRALLLARAPRDTVLDGAHYSRTGARPRLAAPIYVPGFRFVETDKTGLLGIGVGYSADNGLLGAIDMGIPFHCGIMPFAGGAMDKNRTSVRSGLLWRAYRNASNTFGIEATAGVAATAFRNLADVNGMAYLPQASLRIESGWIPVSRVSLFAGYAYPVYNEFHKWEDKGHLFWDRTSPYAGCNLHLIGDLGLTGRYENDRWVAGIFLANLVLGYDGKGLYINLITW